MSKQIRMPTFKEWEELISYLYIANEVYKRKDTKLAGAGQSLVAFISFMNSQNEIKDLGIMKPIFDLGNALIDLIRGRRPELLEIPDHVKQLGKSGPRPDRNSASRKALIVMSIKVMKDAGWSRKDAALYVTREIRKKELDPFKSKPLTCRSALKIYDEDGNTTDAMEILRYLEDGYSKMERPESLNEAKSYVSTLIERAKNVFP